ncbi:MAG: LysM peptidoglycan-binding domain-containing protein [Chloroflexi bacterium]|nr:LysM peptidoglycan-binding domain-containing protein [Chloroflexota bacterium]
MSQSGPANDADDLDDDPDVQVVPARGGGLSGSFADRVAANPSSLPPSDASPPAWSAPAQRESEAGPPPRRVTPPVDADVEDEDEDADQRATSRRTRPVERRPAQRIAPSWERPPRREAYPTLKTRMGLSGVTLPPIFLGIAAVVIAALALFFLPALLGVGNPQPTPGASPTAGSSAGVASASPAEPTALPEPTAQVYLVEAGDTMSRIANRFGVPLQVLIDANKVTIPNPDKLTIGQEVIIPSTAPTLVPDAGGTPMPDASTSP